jgi:hypothetical protein
MSLLGFVCRANYVLHLTDTFRLSGYLAQNDELVNVHKTIFISYLDI